MHQSVWYCQGHDKPDEWYVAQLTWSHWLAKDTLTSSPIFVSCCSCCLMIASKPWTLTTSWAFFCRSSSSCCPRDWPVVNNDGIMILITNSTQVLCINLKGISCRIIGNVLAVMCGFCFFIQWSRMLPISLTWSLKEQRYLMVSTWDKLLYIYQAVQGL